VVLGISINLLAWSVYGQGNVVTDWAAVVQPAINNAAALRPPTSSEVLHTMLALAVYDAVMAVEGGYQPYAFHAQPPPGADVRAAVATAAYKTSRMRRRKSWSWRSRNSKPTAAGSSGTWFWREWF
jgi:hypothetical protein